MTTLDDHEIDKLVSAIMYIFMEFGGLDMCKQMVRAEVRRQLGSKD